MNTIISQKLTIIIITILIISGLFIFMSQMYGKGDLKAKTTTSVPQEVKLDPPQIYGWVAWWKEKEAYQLIENQKQKLSEVSPVWFLIQENGEIKEVGEIDKNEVVKNLKNQNIKIFPTVGTELRADKIAAIIKNHAKRNLLAENLITKVASYNVDGVDIDIEEIKQENKSYFTSLIKNLAELATEKNLKLSVTIDAQEGKNDWEQALGQDLTAIGQVADEIRIMTYDQHGTFSDEGPITPINWLKSVIKNTQKQIPSEKIVIGLPSYGYIWQKDGTVKALQFDEFQNYLKDVNSQNNRDEESQELTVRSNDFTGWLSDAPAMQEKMKAAQTLGVNKFIIWNLGGMDEKFFDQNFSKPSLPQNQN